MFSRPRRSARRGRGHQWTKFELDIVSGLICKGEHLTSSDMGFATKFNESLHGSGNNDSYVDGITVNDVRDLLAIIETEKRGSLAFIERQPGPRVLTRTKRCVFERSIGFTDSPQEWVDGRRDEWLAAKETQEAERRNGLQSSIENSPNAHIDRSFPAPAQAAVADNRTAANWADGDYVLSNSVSVHAQTPILPPIAMAPPTPICSGLIASNATSALPDMMPAAHFPQPIDYIQAQINAISATSVQPLSNDQEQRPADHDGRRSATSAAACDRDNRTHSWAPSHYDAHN